MIDPHAAADLAYLRGEARMLEETLRQTRRHQSADAPACVILRRMIDRSNRLADRLARQIDAEAGR